MFSTAKIIILVVIIAAISAAVGYHYVVVHGLEDQLAIERTNNATLSENNGKLIAANAAMTATITAMQDNFAQINQELGAIHEADANAADNLQKTSDTLASPVKVEQIQKLRAAPDSVKLQDLFNRNSDCTFRHITEAGKCVNGNFVPAK
ncbi:MAG TPA: hypothetical protein VNX68_17390 [Nitrosopumilaceae archaeon]|jgi:hypothetical protein|nr:hypothetical protein [Nitrosopumilaceae archaeon]